MHVFLKDHKTIHQLVTSILRVVLQFALKKNNKARYTRMRLRSFRTISLLERQSHCSITDCMCKQTEKARNAETSKNYSSQVSMGDIWLRRTQVRQ